ncbi:hypothetical protein [Streptomyces sp. E2N166]|uniref:hypothetical protein n=1 Tax=Streptomyces sp. E2N166 TaxID=1851909 RepID=UPI0031F5FA05
MDMRDGVGQGVQLDVEPLRRLAQQLEGNLRAVQSVAADEYLLGTCDTGMSQSAIALFEATLLGVCDRHADTRRCATGRCRIPAFVAHATDSL